MSIAIKLPVYGLSHPDQLSLAILQQDGSVSTNYHFQQKPGRKQAHRAMQCTSHLFVISQCNCEVSWPGQKTQEISAALCALWLDRDRQGEWV